MRTSREQRRQLAIGSLFALLTGLCLSAYFLIPNHGTVPPRHSLWTKAVIGDIVVSLPRSAEGSQAPSRLPAKPYKSSSSSSGASNLRYLPDPPVKAYDIDEGLEGELTETIRSALEQNHVAVTRIPASRFDNNSKEADVDPQSNVTLLLAVQTTDLGESVRIEWDGSIKRMVWLEPNSQMPIVVTEQLPVHHVRVLRKDVKRALFAETRRWANEAIVRRYRESNGYRAF